MTEKIKQITCSICGAEITYLEDGEVFAHTHFDISRSYKEFELYDGEVDEVEDRRNEKMRHIICKRCFDTILNESKTFGSLFFNKEANMFIY